jgi:MFS transporter, PPP family, 3-phenylpropionic acid transporter
VTSSPNYYWRIAGFYFFYFAFVGMFSPYWSLYLKYLQFDAVQISVLMSVQPVMRMLGPAVWGWLADHTRNRRLVIRIAASLCLFWYLWVFGATSFWGMLLVLALMGFFWSASIPLVEATTLTWLGERATRYGRIRSWGSVGFIIAVLGLGYLFDHVSIRWLLWAGLFILSGIMVFAFQIPRADAVSHHTDNLPVVRVLMEPAVLALFGAGFLMAVAHGSYYTFFSIYLVDHGYAKSAVGWLWALGVICEIGVFFLMPKLMRHFSLPHILMVSLVCAVLRFLLIAWAVDVLPLLLLAQVLHAMTFGAFHATAVALVHHFFRGRHQSRGQALYGSVTYGAGGMLGGLISGQLWHYWGAPLMYSFSSLAALLGLLLLLWRLRGMPKRDPAAP